MALRRKPRVAIVHSAKSKYTTAGVDLAVYLGVCLQLGGYADIRIIGFSSKTAVSKATTGVAPHGRFLVVPYGRSKPRFPNHGECCRDDWDSLAECNMVLMCVDPPDSAACAQALSSAVKSEGDVAIISFDMGVRARMAVEKHLSKHGIGLLSGAVGISVARSPVDGCLRCLGTGTLVVERLSKQQSKQGGKFINLLRSGGIPIRHCKNVTSYSHGAIVFNTCHAAAALAGLPLREFLRDRSARLLWAAMIRESLEVLTLAARGGDWRASNPCCALTLPQLELFLCLPTTLFDLVSRLVLQFPSTLSPPMQMDLALGRETGVAWTVGEVVRLADAHKASAPACRAVFSSVTLAVRVGNGVPNKTPQSILNGAYGTQLSASTRALAKKIVAWFCGVSLLVIVLGVFGGRWLVAGGMLATIFAIVFIYVVVGDVVP